MDNEVCSLDNIYGALHSFPDEKAMGDFLADADKVLKGESPAEAINLDDYFNLKDTKDLDALTDSVATIGKHIKSYNPTTDAELQEKAYKLLETHLEKQYDISGPDKKSLVSRLVSSGDNVATAARLTVAATQMKDILADKIVSLSKEGVFNNPEVIEKIDNLRRTFREVFLADSYLGSNEGLALRARQTPGNVPSGAYDALMDDAIPTHELGDVISKISNKEAIKRAIWGTVNKGIGMWTNNVLSGVTLPIAATSNAAQTLLMPVEEALGGALLTQAGRSRLQGTITGLGQFLSDATQIASDAFKFAPQTQQYLNESIIGKVDPIIPQTTAGELTGSTLQDAMWQGFGNMMGVPGYIPSLENMFSMPGRALSTTDTFFRELNQRARLAGLIGSKLDTNSAGYKDEFAKLWSEAIDNPQHQLWNEAQAYGHDVAFTAPTNVQDPTFMQAMATGIQEFKQSKNPYLATLGNFMAPFLTAPANIIDNVKGHIPGFGLFGKEGSDLPKGGHYTHQAAGKQMAGLVMLGAAYTLVNRGLLTGNGPANPEQQQVLKDLGWSPNSIKMGDEWVSLNRFSPVADYLSFFADVVTYAPFTQKFELEDMAKNVSASFINKISNMKMLSGMADFYGVFNKLGHGQDPRLDSATGRFLSGFTPFSGALNVVGTNDDNYMRDARGVLDNILKRIPGVREGLPAKYNILGEAVLEQEHFGFTKKDPKDPVNKEIIFLMTHGGTFTPWGTKDDSGIDFRDFKNAQGVDLYTFMNQNLSTIGDTPLKQKLLEVINSDAYKSVQMFKPNSKEVDEQAIKYKSGLLQQVIRAYRQSAREMGIHDVRFKNEDGRSAFQMVYYDNVGNNARFIDELNQQKQMIDEENKQLTEEAFGPDEGDPTTQEVTPEEAP